MCAHAGIPSSSKLALWSIGTLDWPLEGPLQTPVIGKQQPTVLTD
jgi:hypothetical protein